MSLPTLLEEETSDEYRVRYTRPQSRMIRSTATYPLFVGGFGSGKSITMASLAVRDVLEFPGADIGCYAPTYDLLSLITIPYIEQLLDNLGLAYKFIGGVKHMFVVWQETEPGVVHVSKIICRSLTNPARIVGYEVFRSHIDELDTLPFDKAEDAWNKVVARNRQKIYCVDAQGKKVLRENWQSLQPDEELYRTELNRVCAYTTPEGFAFCYDRWEKNAVAGYEIIRAPTRSNPHLPPEYLENLKRTYPPELVDAYVEGLFVNLTSGAVYKRFDRKLNHSDEEIKKGEALHIGLDFNVLKGAGVVHVLRNKLPVAVGEIIDSYDTDTTIQTIKEQWPDHPIYVYPDSSGKNRTSSNTTATDIAKLNLAGFTVRAKSKNPAVKDRVASMNAMILNAKGERHYLVNTRLCPEYTAALEQQVYDRNGQPDKTAGLDHVLDAGGYYIVHEFGITKPSSGIITVTGSY